MDLIPASGDLAPLIANRLAQMLSFADYIGIGNGILEVLVRPGQDTTPDPLTQFIALNTPMLVARRFGLDERLRLPMLYHDVYVDARLRGNWKDDTFHQIIVFAYAIGATRQNLPSPHAGLVPFYLMLGKRQRRACERLAQEHPTLPRYALPAPEPPARQQALSDLSLEFKEDERTLLESGMERNLIAAELTRLKQEYRSRGLNC